MDKNEIKKRIIAGALQRRIGTCFELSEAFGEGVEDLDVSKLRQAAKEIKIEVCLKEIRGIIFIGKKGSTYVYKRIYATPVEWN